MSGVRCMNLVVHGRNGAFKVALGLSWEGQRPEWCGIGRAVGMQRRGTGMVSRGETATDRRGRNGMDGMSWSVIVAERSGGHGRRGEERLGQERTVCDGLGRRGIARRGGNQTGQSGAGQGVARQSGLRLGLGSRVVVAQGSAVRGEVWVGTIRTAMRGVGRKGRDRRGVSSHG